MDLSPASFDHICNVVRREVQEEFRDLTIFFITYEGDDYKKVLEDKHFEIKDHPASYKIRPFLEDIRKSDIRPEGIAGLCAEETLPYKVPFFKKTHRLAVVFVPTDHFIEAQEAQIHAYHMAWHVLKLIEDEKKGRLDDFTQIGEIIRPLYTGVHRAHNNMLADCFAALMMEMRTEKGFIHDFIKKRCRQTLDKTRGFNPQDFPFPLAADIIRMVYDDFAPEDESLKVAWEMVEEIAATFGETNIQQWQEFAENAQEMAWMDMSPQTILDLATYTSEDPYLRLIAYLLAESLGISPSSQPDLNQYNAFTDQEKNARLHKKAAHRRFENLMDSIQNREERDKILMEIYHQNQALIHDHPLGWCAHALVIVHTIFGEKSDSLGDTKAKAQKAFDRMLEQTPWEDIRAFYQIIIEKQRRGQDVSTHALRNFTEKRDRFEILSAAFNEVIQSFEESLPLQSKTAESFQQAAQTSKS